MVLFLCVAMSCDSLCSGTPSPSLSPFHSPARTPSPPAADQFTKLSTPKIGSAVKSRYQVSSWNHTAHVLGSGHLWLNQL